MVDYQIDGAHCGRHKSSILHRVKTLSEDVVVKLCRVAPLACAILLGLLTSLAAADSPTGAAPPAEDSKPPYIDVDPAASEGPAAPDKTSKPVTIDVEPAEEEAVRAEGEGESRKEPDYYEFFSVLIDSLDQIERNYVHEVDRRELLEAAIDGMLENLDPYSDYISPDEVEKFNSSVESEFGGIGIQVALRNDRVRVISPLVGTPAYREGIEAGDLIYSIDGKSTKGLSLDDVVHLIKGELGTRVELKLVKVRTGENQIVSVTREVVHVDTVLGDVRDADDSWDFMFDAQQKIGYIRITSFSRDTARQVREAMEDLNKNNLRGLVLDLRFNPGGLLTAAVDVSDLFISRGRIVSTKGRNRKDRTWEATRDVAFEDFPMAVLINRYSASASEIVSACLQDNHRAVLIGERTWGKGSVQNVIPLEDGDSILKLTTSGYQRPSGKPIHRFADATEDDPWGVLPDDGFDLRLNPEAMSALIQYRRAKDIVLPTWKRQEVREPAADTSDEQLAGDNSATDEKDLDISDSDAEDADRVDPDFVDQQLQKALDYLTTEIARAG